MKKLINVAFVVMLFAGWAGFAFGMRLILTENPSGGYIMFIGGTIIVGAMYLAKKLDEYFGRKITTKN